MLENEYTGAKYQIVHCKGAIDSFEAAMQGIPARQRTKYINDLIIQINRLADGGRMSKSRFPREGKLPKRKGQQKDKYFRAFKKIPIRGYCWFSEVIEDTYFISHYIHKKKDDLDSRDTTKIGNNWRRIEEKGDEC